MTLVEILSDHAAAMEIVKQVAEAKWNDMVHAHIIDDDTVAAAAILLREIENTDND